MSHHLLCQVKSVPRTSTEYISLCRSSLQMVCKNTIVEVTDMGCFMKLIPDSFLARQTPATLHNCCSGVGSRATRFLQSLLHVLSSQLPSLHIALLDGCETFGGLPCKLCPETHIRPSLCSPPHPITQHVDQHMHPFRCS